MLCFTDFILKVLTCLYLCLKFHVINCNSVLHTGVLNIMFGITSSDFQSNIYTNKVQRQSVVSSIIQSFVGVLSSIRNCDATLGKAQNVCARTNIKMACEVLKKHCGFTKENAEALLDEYNFPYGGRVFSGYTFAQHIKQTGNIPSWAERFKKVLGGESFSVENIETIAALHPNIPEHKLDFHLGKKLGQRSSEGEVFLDADDVRYVIKRYYYDYNLSSVKHNAEVFQRYYGEGSAEALCGEDGKYYLRMYKVPGKFLRDLPSYSLPRDAVNRYVDMLEKLNKVGIMHGQLHSENIFWDEDSQTFFPIDLCNMKEWYFNGNRDEAKETKDLLDSVFFDDILEQIDDKVTRGYACLYHTISRKMNTFNVEYEHL